MRKQIQLRAGWRRMLLMFFVVSAFQFTASAQEHVFQIFQDDIKKGDAYFSDGSYRHALESYLKGSAKTSVAAELDLKLARCYYHLHQYGSCVQRFEKYMEGSKFMNASDRFVFAEALAATGRYSNALDQYREYLKAFPQDELVQKKIWRLRNVNFLYEDSLHFLLSPVSINTQFSEFGAVSFEGGAVFLSNRKGASTFENADAETGENQFQLFFAPAKVEPTTGLPNGLGKPVSFSKVLDAKLHNGPLVFYANESKVVFTRTSDKENDKGKRMLQLFFAERSGKSWTVTSSFNGNNPDYNVTDPWISEDGRVMYFTSDAKGGYGGTDIYKTEFVDGKWTSPQNLGEEINTRLDESYPYVFSNHLYFSSNGHPGLGGLDVFKAPMLEDGFAEVANAGYPLNSSADDFAFNFRPGGEAAFVTSNRKNFNDDIYLAEIDLQPYPVVITGILKAKEFTVSDASQLILLPSVRMFLVDHNREIVVDEVTTDANGEFKLRIPYFSQYKIRVVEKSGAQSIVSLPIPRKKKADYTHEIVVVKEAFHTPDE